MPNDLQSFLLYLVVEPVGLGVLTAAGLQMLFSWWTSENWHAPIRSHDKALVSSVTPIAVALVAYLLLAALGWQPWNWQAAAQAGFNGFLATVGGQWAFGTIKKVISPPPQVVNNTTNVNTLTSSRDVYMGSSHEEEPPHDL